MPREQASQAASSRPIAASTPRPPKPCGKLLQLNVCLLGALRHGDNTSSRNPEEQDSNLDPAIHTPHLLAPP